MKPLRELSPKLCVTARSLLVGAAGLLLAPIFSGCLVIGGRSSRGGFFFIPGGLVGLLIIVLLINALRGRSRY